jgi:hypothetical protein
MFCRPLNKAGLVRERLLCTVTGPPLLWCRLARRSRHTICTATLSTLAPVHA